MAEEEARQQLLNVLEQHVFTPIVRAPTAGYSQPERRTLEELKRRTETHKQRYRSYRSAAQVRQAFEDDLNSPAAKKVNPALRRLRLPTLPDVRTEFLQLADRLGVTRSERSERPHRAPTSGVWQKRSGNTRQAGWRKSKSWTRKRGKTTHRSGAERQENPPQAHGHPARQKIA